MSDLDLLTGIIATRLRALPEVERLYPPQHRIAGIPVTGTSVLTALTSDTTITAKHEHDVLHIEVTLAVASSATTAPAAARTIAALIHAELDHARIGPRHVTVRIASIEA